ncbi:HotDog domain-containing protein [Lipomyces tetrasporus]|uniref:HotDog domain-containing protein n=1 Tax=Lipomyces tetrasporus TaxID=54092 RepID=A0AAD7VR08_9ASCO|nr:HotDog domain-containing protein [Lipomyces tetrasporus]KAJ8098456.1 HotDog domain-containing protein [Lipomyces tetrasporus]
MDKLVDRVSKPSSSSDVQLPPSDFGALMSLEKINANHYRSLKTPFKPAVARGVFGGHLLAQSLYVASKTVPRLYICNNMQAQFLNGNTDSVPFHYLIEMVRDGSRYLVRSVRVFQYISSHKRNGRPCGRSEDKTTLVFTALVSFKKIEEPGQIVIVKDGEDEGVEK